MSKHAIALEFNHYFEQLVSNLATVAPDSLVATKKTMIFDFIHSHKTRGKPVEGFRKHVLPHRDRIIRRDEEFFRRFTPKLTTDFKTLFIIRELIELWDRLNSDNREVMWMYLQEMVGVAGRI